MHLRNLLISSCLVPFLAVGGSISALAEEDVEEISVIGTRDRERSASDLAVPVDVVDGESIAAQGSTRMDQMISTMIPSFNVGQNPLSDAATIVRPANMRGLAADSTLVLINGKRRHRGSIITFLAAGNNQGAHAVDIESIPSVAVGHMEVLRDGASAQYGSDAIAGVINFALKEDSDGGELSARWGSYYQGDGENLIITANKGLPLTDRGFLNFSGEYQTSKPTVRAVQRNDARSLIEQAGNMHVKDPVIDWGAPDIDDNYKLFVNAGLEISDTAEIYAFGSYAERTVDGTFYFRNPYTRSGVFKSPESIADDGDTDVDETETYVNVVDLRGTKHWGVDDVTVNGRTYSAEVMDMQRKIPVRPVGYGGADYTAPTMREGYTYAVTPPTVVEKPAGYDDLEDKETSTDMAVVDYRNYLQDLAFHGHQNYADYEQYLKERLRGGCDPVAAPNASKDQPYGDGPPDLSSLENDDNCYAYIQRFPGGFTPRFGADVEDKSFAFGIRGGEQGKLTYDASFVWGEHESDFFIYRTINPQLVSLMNDIPTYYDPGTYIETDYTVNLDFTTEFDLAGMASPVHMGFGLEYRKEEFEIKAGETNSTYIAYRKDENGEYELDSNGNRILLFPDLGIASNGFNGFRQEDASKNSRASSAAYVDFEADLNDYLMAQMAFRHENPDDYDSRTDGKFALRYQATDTTAVRSSFSTGFRVPTVGQENVRNTTTAFSQGMLTDRLTLPPTHPALSVLGLAPRLEEEEAQSFALGGVFDLDGWDLTIDYYHIEVDDRIAQSSEKDLRKLIEGTCTGENVNLGDCVNSKLDEIAKSAPDVRSIGEVVFFQNSYDTRTEGVDIVATGEIEPFEKPVDVLFTANWTQTEVARHKDNVDAKRIHQVERGVPKVRATLTGHHTTGPWTFMLRGRFYGSHIEYSTDDADRLVEIKERLLLDAEVAYSYRDEFEFIVGAENFLNREPTHNPYSDATGLEFPENPVIDGSGGFYYLKTRYLF